MHHSHDVGQPPGAAVIDRLVEVQILSLAEVGGGDLDVSIILGEMYANGKGTPGRAQLYIDGRLVGQADFAHTTPLSLGLTGGITVGADPGAPVAPFYQSPFEFTGTIHSVTFDVSGDVIEDKEAEMRRIMARQ